MTADEMTTDKITITELSEHFARYTFSDMGIGICGRKWFPDAQVGQVWELTYNGAIIISAVLLEDK